MYVSSVHPPASHPLNHSCNQRVWSAPGAQLSERECACRSVINAAPRMAAPVCPLPSHQHTATWCRGLYTGNARTRRGTVEQGRGGGSSSAPSLPAFLKVHISTPIAGKTNTEEETLSRQSLCWPATYTELLFIQGGGQGQRERETGREGDRQTEREGLKRGGKKVKMHECKTENV